MYKRQLPKERQSLLFSATFSNEIKNLADSMLKAPQLIEVARRNAVSETITHRVYPVAADLKRSLLVHLLTHDEEKAKQVLVFVGTKFGASRLAVYLERQGIAADAIHGDKSQQQRTEALEGFKSGRIRVLVATDVAARGEVSMSDIARAANVGLRHLQRRFPDATGLTLREYARVRRLREALARRLADGSEGWSRVAAETGFVDQAHLTREFVALTGATPRHASRRLDATQHDTVTP